MPHPFLISQFSCRHLRQPHSHSIAPYAHPPSHVHMKPPPSSSTTSTQHRSLCCFLRSMRVRVSTHHSPTACMKRQTNRTLCSFLPSMHVRMSPRQSPNPHCMPAPIPPYKHPSSNPTPPIWTRRLHMCTCRTSAFTRVTFSHSRARDHTVDYTVVCSNLCGNQCRNIRQEAPTTNARAQEPQPFLVSTPRDADSHECHEESK